MAKVLIKPSALIEDNSPLSVEQLKAVMPSRQKQNITQGLVDEINLLVTEPEHREVFRNNLIGYADVMTDPNTTLPGYIRAVRYVSYKLMGYTNQESWMKTFPDRFQRLVDAEKEPSYIRSLVCAYNKGKLVNTILEQTLVPTWVLNADIFQKAINTQVVLMTGAKSEKVRTDAANSILNHLKQPEAAKVEIDIGIKHTDTVKDLKTAMVQLAQEQRDAIERGNLNAKDIAESDIIPGESERV